MKIDHIGIAVFSIGNSRKFYEKLGLKVEHIEEVQEQKVKVAMLKIGESRIELLEPTLKDGAVGKFLDKRGEGLHHIAFEVENIDEKIKELQYSGYEMIDKVARRGAGGNKIAFVHPKSTSGVLLELCQKEFQNDEKIES
jgi:methylmalonyl-CoA/ethylmalonyl-CoA epimerase